MKAKPLAVVAVLGAACGLIYLGGRSAPSSQPRGHNGSRHNGSGHNGKSPDEGSGRRIAPSRQTALGGSDDGASFATELVRQRLAAAKQQMDPRNDGWDTEVFSEAALKQLHHLEDLLEGATTRSAQHAPGKAIKPEIPQREVSGLIVEDFVSSPLRPAALETVWQGSGLAVRRQSGRKEADAAAGPGQAVAVKADALRSESPRRLRVRIGASALCEAWGNVSGAHVHFKLYRVEPQGDNVATLVDYEAAGHLPSGAIQQNATWRCLWRRASGAPPQLVSIEVDDYEEVVYTAPGSQNAMFSDCTLAAVGKNPSFEQQLLPGLDHWVRRTEMIYNIGLDARYGLALGDVDGDELDNVYVCQPGGQPKRLFIHRPDGTVIDRSSEAGVDWLDHVTSALLVDLDNDGDQDLVVGTQQRLVLMENDAHGQFKVQSVLPMSDFDTQSLSAADYDNDGDLDLFVCVDRKGPTPPRATFVFHDARDGGAHTLFRNEISESLDRVWKFTNVTVETGLDKDNFRHSLAAAWEDYDDDGDQDLCIANDYGPKQLYRNDGGRFVEVTVEAGVQDFGSGMSVSWGDYDRDGRMDLYLGNMFSSAGNRIAFQPTYMAQADQAIREIYQRFAKGNTLMRNVGGGKFQEMENAGVELGRWAWSSMFMDINNDGWDDVLVANGFITGDDSSDL